MKKILALLLVGLLVFSMTACSGKKAETPTGENSGTVAVDEGLLTVDITLPASLFENTDELNMEDYAKENGFKKAVKNEDGSVTITMSKSKHKQILADMAASIDENFKSMIGGADTPYIKDITHSQHFETVTADVDKAAYESTFLNMTPLVLGMSAMIYRAYSGEEVRTEIIIRDAATKEIMSSVVYPDSMEE